MPRRKVQLLQVSGQDTKGENGEGARSTQVSDRVVVEIPMLPPKEVSANYHGTLRDKMRATKAWREAGYYYSRQACPGIFPNYEKALLRITYQVPSRKYIKDDDNAIGAAKAALDGCVLAQIIVDDNPECLKILPVMWDIGKEKDRATILEFIKLEEE